MTLLYNISRLKEYRRRLRRDQTSAEALLWSQLRGKRLGGYKFYRQYSVGRYILDFYCPKKRLAIELDGPYHLEGDMPARDAARTRYLNGFEIRVIRFMNDELLEDPDRVLAAIRAVLG